MSEITWNGMPMCECPCCGHKWQQDDWYDLGIGDTLECRKCEKEIEIICIETQMCFKAPDK